MLLSLGHGCPGNLFAFGHGRYNGLGKDALVPEHGRYFPSGMDALASRMKMTLCTK